MRGTSPSHPLHGGASSALPSSTAAGRNPDGLEVDSYELVIAGVCVGGGGGGTGYRASCSLLSSPVILKKEQYPDTHYGVC